MSQVNYESGKRSPDAIYLYGVAQAGVDVGYILTGSRRGAPDFFRLASCYVFETIEKRTGFSDDVLSLVIEALAEAATSSWLDDPEIQADPSGAKYDMSAWVSIYSVDALMAALLENARLLRDVFGSINFVLSESPRSINGARKLDLALMLFKSFKAADAVDTDVVKDAVALVA
jgi:hypothetical protein